MNRSQLLKAVAERTGAHRRDVEHIWENTLSVIQDAIKSGDKVALGGFGTFKQRMRKAREAINPRTGEKIKVAAAKLPRFMPGRVFKQYVSGELRALPAVETRPMALSPDGGTAKKAAPRTAAKAPARAAKAPARGKAKAPAKKAAPARGKAAARKPAARKAAPRRAAPKRKR